MIVATNNKIILKDQTDGPSWLRNGCTCAAFERRGKSGKQKAKKKCEQKIRDRYKREFFYRALARLKR